jgi:hypothetical protein
MFVLRRNAVQSAERLPVVAGRGTRRHASSGHGEGAHHAGGSSDHGHHHAEPKAESVGVRQ